MELPFVGLVLGYERKPFVKPKRQPFKPLDEGKSGRLVFNCNDKFSAEAINLPNGVRDQPHTTPNSQHPKFIPTECYFSKLIE